MSVSIPLVLLLALATPPQAPDAVKSVAAITPLVGDEVAGVVRIDLTKWEVPRTSRRILGKLADEADVADVTKVIDGWIDPLKKAGATELYLLLDLADMPGYPVAVVPLSGGADGKAIADVFKGGPRAPLRWPASETIRGSLVAGTPEALARLREAKPASRPELAAALGSGGNAAIQIAIIPSMTQRRAIEESIPTFPPALGGGPITSVSRGMNWASIALATEPNPSIRLVVQAKDADSAKVLQKFAQAGLGLLAETTRSNPETAELADAIARMKPEAQGDKVTLEADLEKTAVLVSVPVRQAREVVRRSQCVNNMKQFGLAMHNYHSAHNGFPAAYIASKDGKPLLSWRVQILPFLDQKDLYEQFHVDEPWDSTHNKALIARMPKVFACPSGSKTLAAEGKTTYLAPRGPATIFPGAERIKIQEITDGTSNTIMVVDASDELAVIWTRPDDWNVAPEFSTKGLFGHHPRGTEFGMADGSVRFLKETIMPKVLQALTTRNGGEVINYDDDL